ncbi:hypothetical protein YC2023_116369 [Brassica napus]
MSSPARLISEIQSPRLKIRKVLLDCGAVQADALTVDRLASLEKVSDVVPVACRAAADAGIRSLAHLVIATNHLLGTKDESKKIMLTGLTILGDTSLKTTSAHLVIAANHSLGTKGESKKSVLTGLTILGDTSLKTTSAHGSDHPLFSLSSILPSSIQSQ